MAAAALVLYGVYLALTFGIRVAVQVHRTGSTGVHGLPKDAGSLERLAGALFVLALLAGAAAPMLTLVDVLDPVPVLDGAVGNTIGLVLALSGILLTFGAQLAMGDAWRIGVDPEERTELVTGGVFGLCRNPIYSFMIVAWAGFALLVPTWVAAAAGVLLIVGLEIQVRLVEEPHLIRTHGEPYRAWASRVGRFVPGLGRLR